MPLDEWLWGARCQERANLSEDRLLRDEKMQGPDNIDDLYDNVRIYVHEVTHQFNAT